MTPKLSRILPSSRIIPNLAIQEDTEANRVQHEAWVERLMQTASKAFRRRNGHFHETPFPVIFAPVRAVVAAELYVSSKEFETKLPRFREMLKAGLRADGLDDLLEAFCISEDAVSDAIPPFPQMRSLFCYGDPNSNGLEETANPQRLSQQFEREDFWSAALSPKRQLENPELLPNALTHWRLLIADLHAATGKGRTPIEAEFNFVDSLLSYWTVELGCSVYSSRSCSTSHTNQQKGLFPNFVRIAVELIPAAYQPTAAWDYVIRKAIELEKKLTVRVSSPMGLRSGHPYISIEFNSTRWRSREMKPEHLTKERLYRRNDAAVYLGEQWGLPCSPKTLHSSTGTLHIVIKLACFDSSPRRGASGLKASPQRAHWLKPISVRHEVIWALCRPLFDFYCPRDLTIIQR